MDVCSGRDDGEFVYAVSCTCLSTRYVHCEVESIHAILSYISNLFSPSTNTKSTTFFYSHFTSTCQLIHHLLTLSFNTLHYFSYLVDSSNGKARKVFLCSLWLLPVLLGTFVFHSRIWSEEELEQRALIVIANGDEELSMQPMGMITALRKQLKRVCVHEWIAQYNNNTNNNNNINSNINDDDSNSPINKPKEDTTTGTHLCMKLKVTK